MNRNSDRPDEGHDAEQTGSRLGQLDRVQTDLSQFATGYRTSGRFCTDGGVSTGPADDCSDVSDDTAGDNSTNELELTQSIRKYIRLDRNNECELCGARGDDEDTRLDIHHRRERVEDGTDHPDNLLVLCRECHRRHHGNLPIEESHTDAEGERASTETADSGQMMDSVGTSDESDSSGTESDELSASDSEDERGDGAENASAESDGEQSQPLPPRSEPNGADREILSLLEQQGPLSTGKLAAQLDYSRQYTRRQCWKLSGEQLIVPRTDNTWDLAERVEEETQRLGLPSDAKGAQRAGRDEVIRKMSAHGLTHTQIADITDLSRTTIDIAVNRARALRIDASTDDEIDLATIATRLSALLELIDHGQMAPTDHSQTES